MPFESVRGITLPASAVIAQGRFVEIASPGQINQMDGTAVLADTVGVSLEATNLASGAEPLFVVGDVISVAAMDGSKVEVEAGEAIAAGDAIQADSVGRAITGDGLVSDRIFGFALTAADAAGEFVTVLLSKASGVAVNAT